MKTWQRWLLICSIVACFFGLIVYAYYSNEKEKEILYPFQSVDMRQVKEIDINGYHVAYDDVPLANQPFAEARSFLESFAVGSYLNRTVEPEDIGKQYVIILTMEDGTEVTAHVDNGRFGISGTEAFDRFAHVVSGRMYRKLQKFADPLIEQYGK